MAVVTAAAVKLLVTVRDAVLGRVTADHAQLVHQPTSSRLVWREPTSITGRRADFLHKSTLREAVRRFHFVVAAPVVLGRGSARDAPALKFAVRVIDASVLTA